MKKTAGERQDKTLGYAHIRIIKISRHSLLSQKRHALRMKGEPIFTMKTPVIVADQLAYQLQTIQ